MRELTLAGCPLIVHMCTLVCAHIEKKNLIKYVHSKGVYISIFFLISEMSYSTCSVNSKLIISAIWKLPGLYNRKEHICHKDKTYSALRSWSKSFSECWPDPREQGQCFICSVWLRLFQVTLYYKDAQCVREKPAVISANCTVAITYWIQRGLFLYTLISW